MSAKIQKTKSLHLAMKHIVKALRLTPINEAPDRVQLKRIYDQLAEQAENNLIGAIVDLPED